MTRISHMPMPIVSSEDTKDSTQSEVAIAEEDVLVSLHEEAQMQRLPLAIKTEIGSTSNLVAERSRCHPSANTTMPTPMSHTTINAINNSATNSSSNNNNSSVNNISTNGLLSEAPPQQRSSSAVDLTEFAEWIKSKNDHHRHCLMSQPDADQSFLNSLHPFLREMSGKQNRRFRQKVIGLIDAILENAD